MLLYIHVPFCSRKCAYCAFYSLALPEGRAGADMVKDYLSGLLGELRLWKERLGAADVETIFFGGGTPSMLPAKAIGGILDAVGKAFAVRTGAEITAEANPDSALADGWLFEAKSAGLNRLSLGVQSFDDRMLALLGRVHEARAAEAAFHTARSAGFTNVSLDLMWGLPGPEGRPQTQRQWVAQLEKAAELQPEHISAYGLTLEPGSPLQRACLAGALSLPTEKEQASMYLAGAEYLQSRGYMQYEISNYARMGYECRHNLGYWLGADYLGLGPAATSTLGAKRWTNPQSLADWKKQVSGRSIGAEAEDLDAATRLKELLMLRLRTNKGLSLKEWKERTGRSFLKDHAALVALLQKEGLAASRTGWFRLTRTGMLVSDAILAHFFERLEQ